MWGGKWIGEITERIWLNSIDDKEPIVLLFKHGITVRKLKDDFKKIRRGKEIEVISYSFILIIDLF